MTLTPFTMPPDTREVFQADPAADMNGIVDALTALGAPFSVLNKAYGSGGADNGGTNDSTSAFDDCQTAAVAANMPMIIPPGTYKISTTRNWKIPGLKVITGGAQKTIINMTTANTPIIQVAGEGQYIGGLTLRYPTQQTSAQTASIGVEMGDDTIGSCFLSYFEDLRVFQCAKGFATNPAITGTASGVFSCHFGNVEVFGYSISAIDLNGGNGTGAGNTGCVFDNIYIHNNFSGTRVTSAAWPVIFRNWSELVINELNIEKCLIPSPALQFAECGAVVINSLHLEGIEAGGTNLACLGVGSQVGSVVVNAMSVRFSTFTGSTSNAVVQFTAGSGQQVQINGFNMPTSDGGDSTPILALVDFNSIAGSVTVNGINPLGPLYDTNQINAVAGSQLVIQNGGQVTYDPPIPWTSFASGGSPNGLNSSSGSNTVPVAGTWYYCDLFVPFTTTATGLIVPGGSPGGTDSWIVAVWPAAGGTALANSATAGTAAPATNTSKKIAFTTPVVLPGPAVYKVAIQSNGTTGRLLNFSNAVEGFVTGTQAGTFGTVPSLSPGTTYNQSQGPMAKTY